MKKAPYKKVPFSFNVPGERLELSRDFSQRLLRPQRLPISPSGRTILISFVYSGGKYRLINANYQSLIFKLFVGMSWPTNVVDHDDRNLWQQVTDRSSDHPLVDLSLSHYSTPTPLVFVLVVGFPPSISPIACSDQVVHLVSHWKPSSFCHWCYLDSSWSNILRFSRLYTWQRIFFYPQITLDSYNDTNIRAFWSVNNTNFLVFLVYYSVTWSSVRQTYYPSGADNRAVVPFGPLSPHIGFVNTEPLLRSPRQIRSR